MSKDSPHVVRMKTEAEDLQKKIEGLDRFIQLNLSGAEGAVLFPNEYIPHQDELLRLQTQSKYMKLYLETLLLRISMSDLVAKPVL